MRDLRVRTLTGAAYGAGVLLVTFLPWQLFAVAVALAGAVGLRELYRLRRAGIAALVELVLLVLGLSALFWVRVLTDVSGKPAASVPLILIVVLPTWAGDVTAYLVGSSVGRRKIAPLLSPGKTWEGTLAGFVAAGAVALVIARIDYLPNVVPLVLLIGPVGLAGDLLKSWVKRRAGVKDSGTLFPGHGGMLDRIDSLLSVSLLVAALYGPGCCLAAMR